MLMWPCFWQIQNFAGIETYETYSSVDIALIQSQGGVLQMCPEKILQESGSCALVQALGQELAGRPTELPRNDRRLWHGTLALEAWEDCGNGTFEPRILRPNVLAQPPLLDSFATEMDKSPSLQACFMAVLDDPASADFRGDAGERSL